MIKYIMFDNLTLKKKSTLNLKHREKAVGESFLTVEGNSYFGVRRGQRDKDFEGIMYDELGWYRVSITFLEQERFFI